MHPIEQYIDNLFSAIPPTEASVRLKNNLLADSLQRYHDLVAQGMSDAEALGTVVQRFGSMQDIREQLGLPAPEVLSEQERLQKEEAQHAFRSFQTPFALAMVAGVALLMLPGLLSGVLHSFSPALRTAAYVLPVMVAVGLFIFFGLRYSALQVAALTTNKNDQSEEYTMQDSKKAIIWIIASVVYILLGFLWKLWHPGWLVFPIALVIQLLMEMKEGKK